MMLATELNKSQYNQLSHAECLAILSTLSAPALGSIRGADLKFLQVFISAWNLRKRLADATGVAAIFAAGIAEAIHPAYLAAEATFSINLADPNVMAMLEGAVQCGLLVEVEKQQLVALATYSELLFPSITLRDVVACRAPTLIDVGDFVVIAGITTCRLLLKLAADLPEPSTVRIEVRESHNGEDWSHWRRVAHFMNVELAGNYFQTIPTNSLKQQIRWRGEYYAINGTVEAV